MQILVTGGAGFIGSFLVRELAKRHEVVVLDNLSAGKKEDVPRDAKLIVGDVRKPADIAKAIKGCDVVYHLAAQTDVRLSAKKPRYDYDVNFVGTKNVVAACARAGIDKLVYTSSASVYGPPAEIPVKETTAMLPISHYGLHKLLGEITCNGFPKTFIIRIFNVYAASPLSHSVINKFVALHKAKKSLPIYQNLGCTRDYVYINDVVAALLLGLKPKVVGLYNVGSGKETSLNKIIKTIEKLSSRKAKMKFFKRQLAGEIPRSVSDIRKIRRELKWKPKISIEDGIKKVWESP